MNVERGRKKNKEKNIILLFPFSQLSHLPFSQFLDASSHLYKRVCPSVRPSVRRSVRPSVTPSLRRLLGASYAEYSALFSQCVWHISHRIIAMEKKVKNSNVLFCAYSLLTDMLLNISNCYEGPPQSVPRSICYVIFVLMQLAYCN